MGSSVQKSRRTFFEIDEEKSGLIGQSNYKLCGSVEIGIL